MANKDRHSVSSAAALGKEAAQVFVFVVMPLVYK